MTRVEKFWKLVLKDTPTFCWAWSGRTDAGGYGIVGGQRAHRLSYEIHNGPIPRGAVIRHRCDNPPCCNPDHLLIGTAYDNNIDRATRRRVHRIAVKRNEAGPLHATGVLAAIFSPSSARAKRRDAAFLRANPSVKLARNSPPAIAQSSEAAR